MLTLRSKDSFQNENWLIGKSLESFHQSNIPTNGDILRRLCYLKDGDFKQYKHGFSLQPVYDIIIREIHEIWSKTGIPLQRKDKIKQKVEKLYLNYTDLRKSAHLTCKYEKQKNNEETFKGTLDSYFLIAHTSYEKLIETDRLRTAKQKEEDIEFMKFLKENKKVTLGSEDKRYGKKCLEKEQRVQREKQRNMKATEASQTQVMSATTGFEDATDMLSAPSSSSDRDAEFHVHERKKAKLSETCVLNVPKKVLAGVNVCQMADRLNLSPTDVSGVIAALVSDSKGNLNELSVSKSTGYRARKRFREEKGKEIKSTFDSSTSHFILHWDGKLMKINSEKSDRLAVLISDTSKYKEGKLLGVPEIEDSTGLSQANSTINLMNEWNASRNIFGLCFDTTASNSGWEKGACVRVENYLNRKLFYFACRHHVLERIECAAFQTVFGPNSSPDNPLFKAFKEKWSAIDKTKDIKTLPIKDRKMSSLRESVLSDLKSFLHSDSKLRDDYIEVAELIIILLGEIPPRGIHFLKPGAYHHARWMATIIYTAKMYLFSDQVGYDQNTFVQIQRICYFNALVYAKHWLTAAHGVDAPYNDLKLYGELNDYSYIDQDISERTIHIFNGHLWYLTEEIAIFSLFSNKVSIDEKKNILTELKKRKTPNVLPLGTPTFPIISKRTKLSALIGQNSWLLFLLFPKYDSWFNKSPHVWEQDVNYREIAHFVKSVKVVNDLAERAVKLIQDFANSLTSDERQRQYLLQVVEDHRRKCPDFKKKTLKLL